jgi:hypothetical protein
MSNQKEYNKKYYSKNKEKIRQYLKEYNLKNKEKIKQKKKEYNLKNKEKIKQKKKEYYLKNKEKMNKLSEKYYLKNKEKMNKLSREWYLKNKEKVTIWSKEYYKKWYLKNKEYILRQHNKYKKEKRKIDPNFKLISNIRSRISMVLKGNSKCKSTMKLLGCSVEECWKHLESKFQPGMTRENHGKWHIDHIIPCAAFDFRCPVQQLTCFHYSNLQPLWAEQNLSKGAKLDYDLE